MPVVKKVGGAKALRTNPNGHAAPAIQPHGQSFVPGQKYADEYISRTIGTHTDMEVFDYAFENAMNILLFGPTGPGKTSAFLAWAASRGKKFYSIPSNIGIDPSQMFGRLVPDGKGNWKFVDGGVTELVRHGGCLLINEVNFMPERIATALFPLLDKRRAVTLLDHEGEVIQAHRPECWCDLPADECRKRWLLIGADMNPEYAGTRPLNQAFKNRFAIQINWDFDEEIEKQLVQSEILLRLARNTRANQRIDTPVPTNALQEFEKLATEMGIDFAIEVFVNRFDPDERESIRTAFEQVKSELEDDYKPQQPSAWDEFSSQAAGWMHGTRDEDDDF